MARRLGGSHKGNYGHVVVLAGSAGTPGAAILALGGALRAGAGLVSWAADTPTLGNAPPRPAEVMLRERGSGEALDTWVPRLLDAATALVVGPGISMVDARVEEVRELLGRCRVPICMDADGLNILAKHPDLWDRVEAPLVVTPHPKEMSRLTQTPVEDIQRDRIAAAMQLAISRNCVVVLKGAGTVVAEPEGSATVIGAGNPGMATGGTGDVLAGVIGGLLAQGLEASHAAELGALLHAAAGDEAVKTHGQAGLRATDIIDAIGTLFAAWER
jgi:NAD(P)H-hydrate epimerase